jgi:hypothetical protein
MQLSQCFLQSFGIFLRKVNLRLHSLVLLLQDHISVFYHLELGEHFVVFVVQLIVLIEELFVLLNHEAYNIRLILYIY